MNSIKNSLSCYLVLLFFTMNGFSQSLRNSIEIKDRNDNAGSISNALHTGDDIGETQHIMLRYRNQTAHHKYNLSLTFESTEFSNFDTTTLEKRDLLFDELNHFQLAIDNNKEKNKRIYCGASLGLFYIQSNKLTLGATGEKYFFHKYFVSRFWPTRYWVYHASDRPDHYIPYLRTSLGYFRTLDYKPHILLQAQSEIAIQLASNSNYSGIETTLKATTRFLTGRHFLPEIDLDAQAFYQTNLTQYQTSYAQLNFRLVKKRFALYSGILKYISKNLRNPYIRFNDMEMQFNYGVILFL